MTLNKKIIFQIALLFMIPAMIVGVLDSKRTELKYGSAINLEENSINVIVKNFEIWRGTIFFNDLEYSFSEYVCDSADHRLDYELINIEDVVYFKAKTFYIVRGQDTLKYSYDFCKFPRY